MRSVSKQITWLCLLVTLCSVYGFAAHQHSNFLDEAQCAVCIVAHSASPSATYKLPTAIAVLVQFVVPAEPSSAKQRLVPFALTVRPPPAV